LGDKKLAYFKTDTGMKTKQLENSMETHKEYPEVVNMCSIKHQMLVTQ
jgi:hypothetical protein